MVERIITLTIFICLVFLLRGVFYNRLSKCLCYAMWLVVAIHLLVPMRSLSNSFQIMNMIYRVMDMNNGLRSESQNSIAVDKNRDNDSALLKKGSQPISGTELEEEEADWNNEIVTSTHTHLAEDFGKGMWQLWVAVALKGIWLLGILISGTIFLTSNLRFWKRLCENRQILKMDSDYMKEAGHKLIPVYRTKEVNTPCLFGVIHPAIYFPEEGMELENKEKEREVYHYVLAHEYMHYRHKDHLWALLRCLCVVLYWYHPLVWAAAFLSKRDSEFACDESVIRHYNNRERKIYGETLILAGIQEKTAVQFLTCATGMAGGGQELKKRIMQIANPGKLRLGTAVLVCVLLFGVTGCTIGASRQNSGKTGNDYIDSTEKNEEKTENRNVSEKNEDPENEKGLQLLSEPVADKVCILVYPDETGIDWGYYVVDDDKQEKLQELLNNLEVTEIYYEKEKAENLEGDPAGYVLWNDWNDNVRSLGCSITYQGREWELYSDNHFVSSPLEAGKSDLCGAKSEELGTMVWQIAGEKFGYEEFSPEEIKNIQSATLTYIGRRLGGEELTQKITDREILDILEDWLSHAEEIQGGSACPFYEAVLTLELENGKTIKMSMATDSCSMFRVNGVYYDYMQEGTQHINLDDIGCNEILFEYFDEISIPK